MNEPSGTPEPAATPGPSGRPQPPPIPADVPAGGRDGRPEALAAFFEATFAGVYGLALRMLADRQLAEDVAQEVYLRVLRSAATLDPDRDPRPWLRTITANLCRDHWRSFGAKVTQRSVPVDEDPELAPPLPDGGPSPEDDLVAGDRAAKVQAAIAQLPPDLREVVVLRDYEGLDHGTIAAIVGASDAAVRKRYSRALARLGELLQDVGP